MHRLYAYRSNHDPIDRLLLAQALCKPLRLLTSDAFLAGYTDLVILARGNFAHASDRLNAFIPEIP